MQVKYIVTVHDVMYFASIMNERKDHYDDGALSTLTLKLVLRPPLCTSEVAGSVSVSSLSEDFT